MLPYVTSVFGNVKNFNENIESPKGNTCQNLRKSERILKRMLKEQKQDNFIYPQLRKQKTARKKRNHITKKRNLSVQNININREISSYGQDSCSINQEPFRRYYNIQYVDACMQTDSKTAVVQRTNVEYSCDSISDKTLTSRDERDNLEHIKSLQQKNLQENFNGFSGYNDSEVSIKIKI